VGTVCFKKLFERIPRLRRESVGRRRAMSLDWLIPLASAVAGCIAFWLSKPDRRWLAAVGTLLVAGSATREAVRVRSEMTTAYETRSVVHRQLISKTDSILDSISQMLLQASDGWLPNTEAEFFSSRTADLICNHLNISKQAPVLPRQDWRARIHDVFSDYKKTLRSTLEQTPLVLEADLVRAIDKVAESTLLDIGIQMRGVANGDRERGIERAPLLCWGLEPLVEDSLIGMRKLFILLRDRENAADFAPNRQWLVFPPAYRDQRIGKSRFGEADLAEWRRQHPDAPGPSKFGRGAPNKGMIRPRSSL